MDEPKLATGVGEPPAWLDEGARAEWWRVVPDLEDAGVTTRVEATALGCYCQAVSRLVAAEVIIARDGMISTGARGVMKHPAVVIAREQMLVIAKLASEFGMTPSSRTRVKARPITAAQSGGFADV